MIFVELGKAHATCIIIIFNRNTVETWLSEKHGLKQLRLIDVLCNFLNNREIDSSNNRISGKNALLDTEHSVGMFQNLSGKLTDDDIKARLDPTNDQRNSRNYLLTVKLQKYYMFNLISLH